MDVLDYGSSFVIYTGAVDGVEINTCRTQILSRCVVSDDRTGESGDFFLGKECIGEAVYDDSHVAHLPAFEVSVIFSEGSNALIKKYADHKDDLSQVGDVAVRRRSHDGRYAYWTDLRFHLKKAEARPLESRDEIIEATLDLQPMTGRTTLRSDDGAWNAVVEYPIMYMNVHPPIDGIQVDAGPVLLPDPGSKAKELVSRLDYAYVMYNQLDRAEFALRKPTPVGEEGRAETLHYSEIVKYEATNELFSLGR